MFWSVGAGYVLCWVVGLLIGGPSIEHGSNSGEIQAAFSASPGVLIQVLLVHGLAAAFLVLLGLVLRSGPGARHVPGLAVAAGVLSLVQLSGELALIVVPADGAGAFGRWLPGGQPSPDGLRNGLATVAVDLGACRQCHANVRTSTAGSSAGLRHGDQAPAG